MMKKILSTGYTDTAFNLATFLLRVTFGLLMWINHGVPKLTHFSEWRDTFYDPFHIGHFWMLTMSILAEVFASMMLILGVFSRIAAFAILLEMAALIILFYHGRPIGHFEDAILFLTGFLVIIIVGPGKWSVDAMSGK
jgi:putative oxidoreductase